MNKSLKSSLIFSACLATLLSGFGFWYFQNQKLTESQANAAAEQQVVQSLKIAEGLLKRSHPLRALEILREEQHNVAPYPDLADKWAELAQSTAGELGDDRLLQTLYQSRPDLFKNREDLSIRLASNALIKQNFNQYDTLKSEWKNRSTNPKQWFLLEADALALKGKSDEALSLLKSQTLHDEEEIARLLRIALLNEKEHPKVAWEYLSNALRLDPSNGELHFYRAQLLEDTPNKELVPIEYKQAIQNAPENPFYKEVLAKWYLNERQFPEAYHLLESAVQAPSNDKLWLYALFLNQVYKPLPFDFASASVPIGETTPFLRYVLALPAGHGWDSSLLNSQPSVKNLADTLPEALWMEVIDNLKQSQELFAYQILENHPEMATISPDLYEGIQAAIAYKFSYLQVNPRKTDSAIVASRSPHPVFKQLQHKPYSKETENLLSSKEVYAALFLAAGWNEAALNVHQMEKLPSGFPKWVAYGLTQSFASNRTIDKALKFAGNQTPSPQLSLLIGELAIKSDRPEDAIRTLTPLAKSPSDVGAKSASLLSDLYAKKGDLAKAIQTAEENSEYAKSLKGQEKIARLKLSAKDIAGAEKIYAQIVNKSSEAESYFATKAFQAKDYKLAYKLTKALIEKFPHQADLKAQLAEIVQAIKKDSATADAR